MIKSNDEAKYVVLPVEDLRTRVRFPPPPPNKNATLAVAFLFGGGGEDEYPPGSTSSVRGILRRAVPRRFMPRDGWIAIRRDGHNPAASVGI